MMDFTANIPFTVTLLILAGFSNSLMNAAIYDVLRKSSFHFALTGSEDFGLPNTTLVKNMSLKLSPNSKINLLYAGYTIAATAEDCKENDECCHWCCFGKFVSLHPATFYCREFLIPTLSIPVSGPLDICTNLLIGHIEVSLINLLGSAALNSAQGSFRNEYQPPESDRTIADAAQTITCGLLDVAAPYDVDEDALGIITSLVNNQHKDVMHTHKSSECITSP